LSVDIFRSRSWIDPKEMHFEEDLVPIIPEYWPALEKKRKNSFDIADRDNHLRKKRKSEILGIQNGGKKKTDGGLERQIAVTAPTGARKGKREGR